MLRLKDFSFLLFVFLAAFHSTACADTKEQIIEQYRAQGYAQQQKGNLYDALTYFNKAIALGMENAAVWNDAGVLYEEVDMLSRAEGCYLRAIQIDQRYLPPYMNLGYLYLRRGNREKAYAYFKKRYDLGDRQDPWAQKAKEELLKIRPEAREWLLVREAQSLDRELVRKARREFQERIQRAEGHYQKGQDFFKKKQYEQAMAEYNDALRWTPENPKVIRARKMVELELMKHGIQKHADRAVQLLDSGNSASARDEIRRMLATVPSEPVLTSP